MKKFTILLLTTIILVSCGNEIEFNSPALQGNKNYELWRANYYAADIDFGGFLIEGGDNIETVQLITQNDVRGTFELGGNSSSVAIFRDANGIVYSTANAPDPSVSVYPADGQIIVDDISNADPKGVTGSFWFNAYSADGLNYVNFNEGVFYRVPLVGGLVAIDNGSSCLQASQQTAQALNAYNATDISMPEYTDLCNAYKQTLIAQIAECGDTTGALQAIIDSLGTCVP
ncbi:hypothetical protein A9Q87_03135 [Flavobacteriales bacterium 34_180_T64]|nr:hypothetical protein A9Q87_03135 [Flavobacteriales bacterium 34_180_T64]